MSVNWNDRRVTRRGALKLGAGAALAAGGLGFLKSGRPARAAGTGYTGATGEINLVATDGWVSLPDPANPTKYFPDTYAPANRNVYLFGFRDVTDILRAART